MAEQPAELSAEAVVWERRLVIVLRTAAVVTGLAIVPVFFPTSLMASIHEQLGLGMFPDGAIVVYLARSLSAFYAMHGGLLWLVSMDVRRFAPILTYLIYAGLVFGVGIIIVDCLAGMPLNWTVQEGTSVLVLSGAMLFLRCKAQVR